MPAHLAVASAPARPVAPAAPLGAATASTAFSHVTALAERIHRVPAAPAAAPQMRPDYLAIDDLCGTDARMRALLSRGKRFVDRGLPVLILGETGTGKEFLARALHEDSAPRFRAPCPAE